jgi:hypothetical protein
MDDFRGRLHVLTVVFNPMRYHSRWRLYHDFAAHMAASGVVLYTAELTVGERAFQVTEAGNPQHLQLWTQHMLWFKENLLNLLAQRLPPAARYLAWIDADVHFVRPDWASEAVHALQVHPILQPWSEALDLTAQHEPLMRHKSFAWSYHHLTPDPQADPYQPPKPQPQWTPWHPGFSWCCTKDAWNACGGLLDAAILGAADNHMAKSLIGDGQYSMHKGITPGYRQMVLDWQQRAQALHRDLGYVEGLLTHAWHGRKVDRGYWDRWQILVRHQFDPRTDLSRDAQGLWQLVVTNARQRRLRDALRRYFKQRNEDCLD